MATLSRAQRMLPVEPFELLGRDWGRVMNQFLNAEASAGLPAYGVDVRHDAEHLYVEAELPGFKKDEIEITLEKSLLTITAEHKPEQREAPQGEWLLRERQTSRFSRTFTLPATVDGSSVDARLEDGVLKITLNKREEAKPRRITVS